jgi:hypothetical protein
MAEVAVRRIAGSAAPVGAATALAIAMAFAVATSGASAPPAVAAEPGCPSPPWTLADIVVVPSLWGEVTWPPEPERRLACFGDTPISFVASGGMLNAAFPGVEIHPAFGQTIYLDSDPADDKGWDLNAWIPPDIGMGPEDVKALEMTSPGQSSEGMRDVWWRGRGHFDDPAAAECRPGDGTSTIDGVPLVLTPAEAVELCRNEFVIDKLDWLPVPPTDTLPSPEPAAPGLPSGAVAGLLGLASLVIMLSRPLRTRRKR